MTHSARHLLLAAAVFTTAALLLHACKKEPLDIPDPQPRQESRSYTSDSTDIEITDSITVTFGSRQWRTLSYTSRIDTIATQTGIPIEWATIEARHPQDNFPAFKLIIALTPGTYTSHLGITDPGLGYTVPGQMYREPMGGDIYYSDSTSIRTPDGTILSDWRPLSLTTTTIEYNNYYHTLTATATGLMYHFGQWLDSASADTPINVADADTCSLTLSFGNLKIAP